MTQHQMKNVGSGNDPDSPLLYIADLTFPSLDLITPLKARLLATSETDAYMNIHRAYPEAKISNLYLL